MGWYEGLLLLLLISDGTGLPQLRKELQTRPIMDFKQETADRGKRDIPNKEARKAELNWLVGEGQKLLATFHNEKIQMNNIAFKNKQVIQKLDAFIESFSAQKMVKDRENAIDALRGAENVFSQTEQHIIRLTHEEKNLDTLVQKLIERGHQGSVKSGIVQADMRENQAKITLTQQQIHETNNKLYKMQLEVAKLEEKLRRAHLNIKKGRKNRVFAIIGTIFTLGLGAPILVANERDIQDNKNDRSMYQNSLSITRNQLNGLYTSQTKYFENSRRLQEDKNYLQQEQATLADILPKLQAARIDTIKYRRFLTSLNDSCKDANVHVHHLIGNLEELNQFHQEVQDVPSEMEAKLDTSHNGLKESWSSAKSQSAVQVIYRLHDINDVNATLSAIKTINW